uniref:Uncharacterized protein n=1 Tax=Arundo donax TaxID=35708 RepID=A0A0A9AN78_ARUDO
MKPHIKQPCLILCVQSQSCNRFFFLCTPFVTIVFNE